MKAAQELSFGALPSYAYGVDAYDPTKLGLGKLMMQHNGPAPTDNWAGPYPVGVVRPMEYSTPMPTTFPLAMSWSETVDWIFLADNAATAATRRLMLATYDRSTQDFNIAGFITVNFPTATNHTIRGFRGTYDLHTAGTVAVNGTAVSGSGTSWLTDRACVGNRIGFGNATPKNITAWYEIEAINSNGSITLTTDAGIINANTPYVIEDIRGIILTTNATPTNGGLFVVKGLRPEIFNSSGTAIAAATTVDNIRACYWLADAATETNVNGFGLCLEQKTSFQSQIAWCLDTTTNVVLYKYNLREALSNLSAGRDTSAFLFKTGYGGALTGTAGLNNNARFVTAQHGPGAGLGCIYFSTTTRVYRSIETANIISGSVNFIADTMNEIPPGGIVTFAASSLIGSVDYCDAIDKFLISITNSITGVGFRDYLTAYKTDGSPFERITFADIRQLNQSSSDSSHTDVISKNGRGLLSWSVNGLLYLASLNNTVDSSIVFVLPIGADWEYSNVTHSYIVTPKVACSQAAKFSRVLVNAVEMLGGASGLNLGQQTEPIRISYRTAGIDDNTGAWTLVDDSGDLSGVTGNPFIQFNIEFRIIGLTHIPGRVLSLAVIYDSDDSLPAELRWNLADSDNSNGMVGITQTDLFASLTSLTITYYRADTHAIALVQSSADTNYGVWEHWSGSAWVAGLAGNAVNMRRRFRPTTGLPVGVDVYAKVVAA